MSPLFERMADASGLPSVIRKPALARALRRVGLDPATVEPRDLPVALDSLLETLRVYLTDEESGERLRAIAELQEQP